MFSDLSFNVLNPFSGADSIERLFLYKDKNKLFLTEMSDDQTNIEEKQEAVCLKCHCGGLYLCFLKVGSLSDSSQTLTRPLQTHLEVFLDHFPPAQPMRASS